MNREKFKEIRLKLGLSQGALSEKIGLEVQSISRIENGRQGVTPMLARMMEILLESHTS